eukprot:gene28784-40787_t
MVAAPDPSAPSSVGNGGGAPIFPTSFGAGGSRPPRVSTEASDASASQATTNQTGPFSPAQGQISPLGGCITPGACVTPADGIPFAAAG